MSNLLLHYLAKSECSTAQLFIHISHSHQYHVRYFSLIGLSLAYYLFFADVV